VRYASRVPERLRSLLKAALLLALLGGAVWVYASGLLRDVDIHLVRDFIQSAGPWGPLLYLALFALLQPIGLSAHVLVPAAALAWPPAVAIALGWLGSMLSASVAFFAARTVARDWIQSRVPARMHRWDDALAERGFVTVLFLRLVFWTAFPVQLAMGLSAVRWRDYALGTLVGNLPMVAVEVLCIDAVLRWLG